MKNATIRTGVSILDIEKLEKSGFKKESTVNQIGTVLRCRLDKLTLEATGKVIGRTRERVRQMEAAGCEWVRHN
jgi:hypothetical protein